MTKENEENKEKNKEKETPKEKKNTKAPVDYANLLIDFDELQEETLDAIETIMQKLDYSQQDYDSTISIFGMGFEEIEQKIMAAKAANSDVEDEQEEGTQVPKDTALALIDASDIMDEGYNMCGNNLDNYNNRVQNKWEPDRKLSIKSLVV